MLPAALLCDMDGTLVDTERQWLEVVAELLPPGTDTEPFAGVTLDQAAGALIDRYGRAEARAELVSRLDALFTERVSGGVRPRPGALRLLDRARAAGVPVALVTASERHVADLVIRGLGADRFATTVAGREGGRTKPHPDPYLRAARELGVAPGDCLAVEDTPLGATAALAAGCRLLAVPTVPGIPEGPGIVFAASLLDAELALPAP